MIAGSSQLSAVCQSQWQLVDIRLPDPDSLFLLARKA